VCAVDCARLCALLLFVKDERQLQAAGATTSVKAQDQAAEGRFVYWSAISQWFILRGSSRMLDWLKLQRVIIDVVHEGGSTDRLDWIARNSMQVS